MSVYIGSIVLAAKHLYNQHLFSLLYALSLSHFCFSDEHKQILASLNEYNRIISVILYLLFIYLVIALAVYIALSVLRIQPNKTTLLIIYDSLQPTLPPKKEKKLGCDDDFEPDSFLADMPVQAHELTPSVEES